jgi:hypothetical protein
MGEIFEAKAFCSETKLLLFYLLMADNHRDQVIFNNAAIVAS